MASDLILLVDDESFMVQLLVDNALKFTPAGGNITLRAAQASSGIQVEVADTGAGISPEALPHIFDRFYQADPSRPGGRKHGSGLGLAIVKEIVGAHGGKISVRSEPGTGSTFTVSLPLTTPEASTIVSKPRAPRGNRDYFAGTGTTPPRPRTGTTSRKT